ncbi:citrate lyase acyl carrier protein [Synergistaceae bacterium OttesenSCG-928-I11]|nr:citrate lyase acyl carrier protein [Synergistaceae bacterium OttesenSCG-928-I11]
MNEPATTHVAQAGTLESMDCLVSITGAGARAIEISGSSAARFKGAIEKKIGEVLDTLSAKPVKVTVQDNGAIDVVLGARVEAAYRRFERGPSA